MPHPLLAHRTIRALPAAVQHQVPVRTSANRPLLATVAATCERVVANLDLIAGVEVRVGEHHFLPSISTHHGIFVVTGTVRREIAAVNAAVKTFVRLFEILVDFVTSVITRSFFGPIVIPFSVEKFIVRQIRVVHMRKLHCHLTLLPIQLLLHV